MCKDKMVYNLTEIYNRSSKETVVNGKRWYAVAHSFARELADKYMLQSVSHAAGIISVLSPSVQWEVNLNDADKLCATRSGESVTVSTYGQQKVKAEAIRDGDNPSKWISPKTAPKTYAFWRCLLNPRNTKHVVIDRHALAACHGHVLNDRERGLELRRVGRYGFYSDCYREAAKQVGILPLQMQAVCWLHWRLDH